AYGNERHQIWPTQLGLPDPIVYKVDLLLRTHQFTTSNVLPIDALGQPAVSFDSSSRRFPAGVQRNLPESTIYGFNGTFPGPKNKLDVGDERYGYRLPGVRTNNPDGSFDVAYDIPLVIADFRLEDGVTVHQDAHDLEFPAAGNPRQHPEWWGKTFYKHMPNHGF